MTDTSDDAGRSTVDDERRPPFCYQTHDALDAIRTKFDGAKRGTALAVYVTLTEHANRAGGSRARSGFRAARAALASSAGVSTDTFDRYASEFVKLGLLRVVRERLDEAVHRPNRWILTEPAHVRGVAADVRPGVAADVRPKNPRNEVPEEENPPNPPRGELDRVTPANRPAKVNRKTVTDAEYGIASAVLEVFNRAAGTRYGSKDYVAKVVSRTREHPELDLHAHGAVIAHALAHPWWDGPPSPSVVYGNASLFERAVHAAAAGNNGAATRGLTPDEIATYGSEWGPGTEYDSLAQARSRPHADIEIDAEEVTDD